MDKTSLGDRMKKYELTTKAFIQPRTPTIIRVDGKAFHTFTKIFSFPFSPVFHDMMASTAMLMMSEIQNARIAYHQSDEISILLNDWSDLGTQQWFGGNLQKMCSVAAATATAGFVYECGQHGVALNDINKLPKFDARVFQMPREEVCNYFIFRQQDASRNSIQMLGRSKFSHKELHKKNISDIQDMLMAKYDINWNELDVWKRRGECIVASLNADGTSGPIGVDNNIPIFTKDRNYIERHLEVIKDNE